MTDKPAFEAPSKWCRICRFAFDCGNKFCPHKGKVDDDNPDGTVNGESRAHYNRDTGMYEEPDV